MTTFGMIHQTLTKARTTVFFQYSTQTVLTNCAVYENSVKLTCTQNRQEAL